MVYNLHKALVDEPSTGMVHCCRLVMLQSSFPVDWMMQMEAHSQMRGGCGSYASPVLRLVNDPAGIFTQT